MMTVPLHGDKAAGRVALVDDGDYDLVMQYRWNIYEHPGHTPYATTKLPGRSSQRSIAMHRLLTGSPLTDHHDRDGLNNRRANLRTATPTQNSANQGKRTGMTSFYKGVSWKKSRRRWLAQIKINRKGRYLGLFANEIDAAHAYDAAARELFGEFACLNFPGDGESAARERPEGAHRSKSSRTAPNRAGTSTFRGVFWNGQKQRWSARICLDGKQRHLGSYRSEAEAADAYDVAARKVHGESAWLNFPDGVPQATRDQWHAEREAAESVRARTHGEIMANWWADREPTVHACQLCGTQFSTKSPRPSSYCGNKCRTRAWRQHAKEPA